MKTVILTARRRAGKTTFCEELLGRASAAGLKSAGILTLTEENKSLTIKSYSHGLVSVLLNVAKELNVVELINDEVKSQRPYFTDQPIRNNLTVGATLLLAAIGRICKPTSKDGWYGWAKRTSLSYLLRMDLSKLDSQHFRIYGLDWTASVRPKMQHHDFNIA
jgi:hypothetical protein